MQLGTSGNAVYMYICSLLSLFLYPLVDICHFPLYTTGVLPSLLFETMGKNARILAQESFFPSSISSSARHVSELKGK